MVWEDNRNLGTTGWDIYKCPLAGGAASAISTASSDQYYPVVAGQRAAWQDYRNGNWDIYSYALPSGPEAGIFVASGHQRHPQIWDSRVVWQDDIAPSIRLLDLVTKERLVVSDSGAAQDLPAIFENRIVWQDSRLAAWATASLAT